MIQIIITSSVLILLILMLRQIMKGKISLRLQYSLWGLVILRLMFPLEYFEMVFGSRINSIMSIMNAVQSVAESIPIQMKPLMNNISTGVMYKTDHLSISPMIRAATIDWQLVLSIVWFMGSVVIATWLIAGHIRFAHHLIANRKRLIDYQCKLPVYTVSQLPSPCLFAWRREQAIYLTPDMAADPKRMRHILAHELCHYKHLDHIWAILRAGLAAFYWFNPMVWIAAIVSKHDAELACDEAAIKMLGEDDRLEYGRTLIGLISVKRNLKDLMCTATTMTSGESGIKKRIRLIAKKPKILVITQVATLAIVLFIVGCTFTNAKDSKESGTRAMTLKVKVTAIGDTYLDVIVTEEKNGFHRGDSVQIIITDQTETDNETYEVGDLRYVTYYEIQEFDPVGIRAYRIFEQENMLTIEAVKELSKKGEDLGFEDFRGYDGGTEIGSGLYIYQYPIVGGKYGLIIGGTGPTEKPFYITLYKTDANEEAIDIRTDNIDDYLSKDNPALHPMIYFNDRIYYESPMMLDLDITRLVAIGEVIDVVDSGLIPQESGYANHNIKGAVIYENGNSLIVFWNGEYLLYELEQKNMDSYLPKNNDDTVTITTDRNSYIVTMSSARGIKMTPDFKSKRKYNQLEYHWITDEGEFISGLTDLGKEVKNQGETVLWSAIGNDKVADIKGSVTITLEVIDSETQKVLAHTKLIIHSNEGLYEVEQ